MILRAIHYSSSDRVRLELEGGSDITTSLGTVAELHLHTGQELDSDLLALIREKTALVDAKEYALWLVSRRMYSRKELQTRFSKRGTPSAVADTAIDWLENHGYLDDRQYAQAIVRHYSSKGYGLSRLRSELYKRGIDRELRDEVLTLLPDSSQTIDRLLRNRLHNPEDRDELRKAGSYLSRRGFTWEEITAAIERYHETL